MKLFYLCGGDSVELATGRIILSGDALAVNEDLIAVAATEAATARGWIAWCARRAIVARSASRTLTRYAVEHVQCRDGLPLGKVVCGIDYRRGFFACVLSANYATAQTKS